MGRLPKMLLLAVTLAAMWPGAASARHNFSILEATPETASPGETVTVRGFSYTDTAVIRFGSLDGPVLAELEPSQEDIISGEVVIPLDASPSRTLIYAVQESPDGDPTRLPGRAPLTIEGAPQEPARALVAGSRPTAFEDGGGGSALTTVVAAAVTVVVLGAATAAIVGPGFVSSSGRRR